MQTFLIVSLNQNFINQELEKIKTKLKVGQYNFEEVTPDPSIGIKAVKKIQSLLNLKPYDGGNRLIVINQAHKATIEAQNALLKILEEPPAKNYIVLVANNQDTLLPTIISRSQIILERGKVKKEKDYQQVEELLTELLKASIGKRIEIAQKYSNSKQEALFILDKLIEFLENSLHYKNPKLTLPLKTTAQLIKKITIAQKYIERNINYKATLDILFLGFPKGAK